MIYTKVSFAFVGQYKFEEIVVPIPRQGDFGYTIMQPSENGLAFININHFSRHLNFGIN